MVQGMDALPPLPEPADPERCAQWTAALIEHRRTILPKRLFEPGPSAAQLDAILSAAAAAPDHGELLPWRFVLVPAAARARLAEVFAAALLERDSAAAADDMARAREKAFRGPLLLLAIVRTGAPGEDIPPAERLLSAGCAIQNMLLIATAMGFGSALTSGKALQSQGLRSLFAVRDDEQAVCFVSVGTADRRKAGRQRPHTSQYVSTLPIDP